jgi:tetratricopeptide (TPR) repeat protein
MLFKSISFLSILLGIIFLIRFPTLTHASTSDPIYSNGKYNHPYLKQADSLVDKNIPDKALEAYISAFQKFTNENDQLGQITAACNMGRIYTNFGAYDSAKFILTKAKQIFEGSGKDSILLSDIYFRIGILHDYQFQPDSALAYHDKALKLRVKKYSEISEPVASIYNAIADIYRYTFSDYFTAESYYLKALGITEKLSERDQNKMLATICYNLATTNRLKGDIEKAITYANQSYNYYSKNNAEDYFNFSLCFNVLANSYYQKSQYDESLSYFHKAVSNLEKVPQYFPLYITTFYTNMGAAFSDLNKPDSALYYLRKALKILEKQENQSPELSHTYQQIGVAQLKKNSDSALYYYEKSLVLSQEILLKLHGYILTLENSISIEKIIIPPLKI